MRTEQIDNIAIQYVLYLVDKNYGDFCRKKLAVLLHL